MSTPNIFTSSSYEQDPRWTAVDAYTLSHLHSSSHPTHPALVHALRNSIDQGLPNIASHPTQAKFLALHCKSAGVTHALELGTLGGYNAIFLTLMNPSLRITTVEFNPHHAEVARSNIEFAGVQDRVEVIRGAGLDVFLKLRAEVEAGERAKFGFVYLDADTPHSWEYFDLAVAGLCQSRAALFIDNVVLEGTIISEDGKTKEEPQVQGAKELIEKAGNDPRVEAVVMQTVGEKTYDGFFMAVVL